MPLFDGINYIVNENGSQKLKQNFTFVEEFVTKHGLAAV